MIPQEWEEAARKTTGIGWTDPRKAEGGMMFPERFPVDVLAQERARLGSSGYSGRHQLVVMQTREIKLSRNPAELGKLRRSVVQ